MLLLSALAAFLRAFRRSMMDALRANAGAEMTVHIGKLETTCVCECQHGRQHVITRWGEWKEEDFLPVLRQRERELGLLLRIVIVTRSVIYGGLDIVSFDDEHGATW